eukprot:1192037-Prorocentrum_minimum.AAC.3
MGSEGGREGMSSQGVSRGARSHADLDTRVRKGGREGVSSQGKYRSSVDAREPQSPTKSEEHQKHLQGVLYGT